jgi:hypothetical protein
MPLPRFAEMSRGFSPQDPDDIRRGLRTQDDRTAASGGPDVELSRTDSASPSCERIAERSQENSRPEIRSTHGRVVLYDRDRGYRLRESEIRTIAELDRFRLIATRDLARHAYAGHVEQAESDIQNLVRKGLVRKGTFEGPEATPRELLTLTKRGHRLLRANRLVLQDQAVYHGFVKPKEANHDADLYLLYQKEAARIEKDGGRNLRVILDYELKRKINRDVARFGTTAKQEIAARHGLRVVGNKIPLPDMRIEYETRDGDMARVNLELVTEHYRGRSIAEKARAGFSLYTPHGEADHLRRVLDQHELTADILSL